MPDYYGSKFYTRKELDHSFGHAFLSAGGDLFYSPNCSRRVDVPFPTDDYPFGRRSRFEDFITPRWWTKPYHFLAFVHLRPLFEGSIFGCIRDIVSNIEEVEGGMFALTPQKVEHWTEVEESIYELSRILNKWYFTRLAPSLTPNL